MTTPLLAARCWAGFADRIVGIGVDGSRSEFEGPSSPWSKVAGVDEVLAVLRDDRLELRDGRTGERRVDVPAPFASAVRASLRRFWLDEGVRGRPVDIDGRPHEPVALRGALGLVAVSERWLAASAHEAFDSSTIQVVSTAGAKGVVFSTPSLANPTAAAFTGDGLVVAHDGGIQCWPLDGRSSRVVHQAPIRVGLATIVAGDGVSDQSTDAPWFLLCEDVLSERVTAIGQRHEQFQPVEMITETRTRLLRVRHGEVDAERVLDGRTIGLAAAAGHLWVLVSKTDATGSVGAAGPVACRILDERLEDVDRLDFGDADWRGGFVVCAGPLT